MWSMWWLSDYDIEREEKDDPDEEKNEGEKAKEGK